MTAYYSFCLNYFGWHFTKKHEIKIISFQQYLNSVVIIVVVGLWLPETNSMLGFCSLLTFIVYKMKSSETNDCILYDTATDLIHIACM